MDSCNLTNKANSYTPKVEIHTRQKLCHFGRYAAKAKLFCLKSFVPVYRAGVAWNSLTNKETTAETKKYFKRCLRKFDTDKKNFEPILAITNNRDSDYEYF